MAARVIVETRDLSMKYHTLEEETAAIENLSMQVEEGEFISIIGPSGCGKSTLLSLICGLMKPSGGEVFIGGERVEGPNPRIGYMPQRDQLFPWRNILDNVLIGLEVQHKLNDDTRDKAKSLLNKYGLGDFLKHYPNQLSGGMRQRVALIRTLAVNPDILLLDEPFSALDYQTRLAVSDEVRKIIYSENKTTILVTHDIAEGISMSDRVVVLTKRPAYIKNIHKIQLSVESISPIDRREAPEFRHYFNQVWKELDVK